MMLNDPPMVNQHASIKQSRQKINRYQYQIIFATDLKKAMSLQHTMFKLVVFLVFVVSALSQELDETAAEERAVEKEAGKFKDDKEGEMFIEGDEKVNKDEMPEGSSEGKSVVVLYLGLILIFPSGKNLPARLIKLTLHMNVVPRSTKNTNGDTENYL